MLENSACLMRVPICLPNISLAPHKSSQMLTKAHINSQKGKVHIKVEYKVARRGISDLMSHSA